jgi:hypothetical protein
MDTDGRGTMTEDRSAARARFLGVLRLRAAELPPVAESRAVDTGCSIGIGCTIATILIMLIGVAIIIATRW